MSIVLLSLMLVPLLFVLFDLLVTGRHEAR
jgi:hypothetical protein